VCFKAASNRCWPSVRRIADPGLLILDEPSLGVAPRLVDEIFQVMKRINREDGVTILVAEQNAMKVLQAAERACVLENVVHEGTADALLHDQQIQSSYLGVGWECDEKI
jgi:branched-chain amino acid transport system ATP-binding protein